MGRLDLEKVLAIFAMTIALTVLMLYTASLFSGLAIFCCLFAVFFLYILSHEALYLWGFFAYALSLIISGLLCGLGAPLLFYLVLGHYGLFRPFLDKHMRDPITGCFLKLAYLNAFILIAVLTAVLGFSIDLSAYLPNIPRFLLILLMECGLFAMELLFGLWQKFYKNHIRNAILPRK